jgi:hypothetical protein
VDGGDAGAGGDRAREVEGVDGADADELALLLHAADLAEGLHGFGPGVLLAVEAGDEAAASDAAAGFHAAEGSEDVAPGDRDVLALDEVAEDDAVAEEELFGPGFGDMFRVGDECRVLSAEWRVGGAWLLRSFLRYLMISGVGMFFDSGMSGRDASPRRLYTRIVHHGRKQRPAAGREADGEGAEEAGALWPLEVAALGGGHEGAEGLEAVGGDEASGDEVPESAFDVGGEAAAGGGDVVVEEGSAGGEEVEDVATRSSAGRSCQAEFFSRDRTGYPARIVRSSRITLDRRA